MVGFTRTGGGKEGRGEQVDRDGRARACTQEDRLWCHCVRRALSKSDFDNELLDRSDRGFACCLPARAHSSERRGGGREGKEFQVSSRMI